MTIDAAIESWQSARTRFSKGHKGERFWKGAQWRRECAPAAAASRRRGYPRPEVHRSSQNHRRHRPASPEARSTSVHADLKTILSSSSRLTMIGGTLRLRDLSLAMHLGASHCSQVNTSSCTKWSPTKITGCPLRPTSGPFFLSRRARFPLPFLLFPLPPVAFLPTCPLSTVNIY